MNLILILKELWRRRLLVALSVVLAFAVSVFAVYQVSFAPPSLSQRSKVNAHGTIEILVDSARSPIADARRDLSGLIARAGVFARLIAGGNVVGEIAKATGIPVKQIDVAGPTPLPGEAPGIEPVQLHPYGIAITPSEELPILNVDTRAPTVRQAKAMAAAAPGAVRRVVQRIQAEQETPAASRVEFRVLGPAEAGPVDDALGKKVALALFVVMLALCIVAILGFPRLVRAWRSAEAEPVVGLPDPPVVSEEAPDVLHLSEARSERHS